MLTLHAMAGTALVLSGGGMFGAYQAGVWNALEECFDPEIVVGASVGSLNAWAIAGGISGAALIETWLDPVRSSALKLKFPQSARDGVIDARLLETWIQTLHATFHPKRRIGVALTEMWSFKPALVESEEIEWQHLAASCAVPGFLPQYRIGDKNYADGGLLTLLPMWAAAQMGASRIVGVNLLPNTGWPFLSRAFQTIRNRAGWSKLNDIGEIPTVLIAPDSSLGAPGDMIRWTHQNAEGWIERGRRDALAKKHLVCDMF